MGLLAAWWAAVWPNLAASGLCWLGVELRSEARHRELLTGRRPATLLAWKKPGTGASTPPAAARPAPPSAGTPGTRRG